MSLAVAPRLSLSVGQVNRRLLLDLIKALVKVKQHQRKTHTGQIVQVAAHYRNYLTAHEKKGMIAELAAKMAGGNKVAHKTLTSAKAMAKATAKSTGKEVHVHYDEGAGKYVTSHEPPAAAPAPGKHHLTAHANGKVMMKHELHGHIEANPLLLGKQLHQVGAKAVEHYAKITAVSKDLKGAEAEQYRQLLHDAHKIAIQQALDKGEKVSAAALKAHPEFQAKADEVLKTQTEAKAKKAAEKLEKMSEANKAKQQEKKKTKHAAAAIAAQAHEEAATKYGHNSDEAASAGTELKKHKVLLHPQEDGTTHYKIGDETIHTANVHTHPDQPASDKKPGAQPGNQNAYKGGPEDEPAHGKVLPGDTEPTHATPAAIAYAQSLGDGPAAKLYQESLKTADYHEGRVKKIGAKLWAYTSVTGQQGRYPVPTKKQAMATAKMNAVEELATLKKNAEEEAALSAMEGGKGASKAGEVVTAGNAEPGDVVKSKHYDGDCVILGPSSQKIEHVDESFLKVLTPNGHVDNLLPSGLVHTGENAPDTVAQFEDAKKGPVASGKTGPVTMNNFIVGDWLVSGSGKPVKVVSVSKSGEPIGYAGGQSFVIDLHGKTFWQAPEDAKKEAQAALIGQVIKHVKQVEPGQYIHNPALDQIYQVQESDAGMTTLKAPDGSVSEVHTASLVGSKFADKDDFTKSDKKPGGQPGNQNAYKGGPKSKEGAAALKQAHEDIQTLSKTAKDRFSAWIDSVNGGDSKDEQDIANRHFESANEKLRHAEALYAGHALNPAQMQGLNDFMLHANNHGYRDVEVYVKNNPEGLADGSVLGGAILSYKTASGDKRYTRLNVDGQTNLGTSGKSLVVDQSTGDGQFYGVTSGMLHADAHQVLKAHLKPLVLANGAPVYTIKEHKAAAPGNIGGSSSNPTYLHIEGGTQAINLDMDDNIYHKATLSGQPFTHKWAQSKGQKYGHFSVNANHGGYQAFMDPVLSEAGLTTEQALMWHHLTKGFAGHNAAIKPIAAGVSPEGNLVIKYWSQPYKKGNKPVVDVITPEGDKDMSAKPILADVKPFHGQFVKPEEVASAGEAPAGAIEAGPGTYIATPSIKAVYQGEHGIVKHGTGPDGNGVELRFSAKPDADTLADVKKFFKWSGMSQCWWAKNPGKNAIALAHKVMGTGKTDAGKISDALEEAHPTGNHLTELEKPLSWAKKVHSQLNVTPMPWNSKWVEEDAAAQKALNEAEKAVNEHIPAHVAAHLNDAQLATAMQHPDAKILVHWANHKQLPILEMPHPNSGAKKSGKVLGAYINPDGSLSQSWEANPGKGKTHPGSYGKEDYVSAKPLQVQAASGKKPGGQPGNQNAYKGGPQTEEGKAAQQKALEEYEAANEAINAAMSSAPGEFSEALAARQRAEANYVTQSLNPEQISAVERIYAAHTGAGSDSGSVRVYVSKNPNPVGGPKAAIVWIDATGGKNYARINPDGSTTASGIDILADTASAHASRVLEVSGKKPGGQPGNQNAYKGGPEDEPGASDAPTSEAEPEKPFKDLPGEALSNGKSGLASASNIKPGDVLSFEGEKAVLLGYNGFTHTYQFKAADGIHSVSDEILVASSDEYHKDGPITHTGTKIDFKAGEPANLDNIEPGDKIEFPTHDGSGEGNPVKPYTVVKYKDSAGEVYLKGEDGKEIAVTAGLFDPKSVAYHMHGPILHSSKKPGGQPGNQNAYKGGPKDEPGTPQAEPKHGDTPTKDSIKIGDQLGSIKNSNIYSVTAKDDDGITVENNDGGYTGKVPYNQFDHLFHVKPEESDKKPGGQPGNQNAYKGGPQTEEGKAAQQKALEEYEAVETAHHTAVVSNLEEKDDLLAAKFKAAGNYVAQSLNPEQLAAVGEIQAAHPYAKVLVSKDPNAADQKPLIGWIESGLDYQKQLNPDGSLTDAESNVINKPVLASAKNVLEASGKKPGGQPGNQNAYKGGPQETPAGVEGIPQSVIENIKAKFEKMDPEKVQAMLLQVKAAPDGRYIVGVKDPATDKIHFAAYDADNTKIHSSYPYQIKTILNSAKDVTEQITGKPASLKLPDHEQPHPTKPAKPNGKEHLPGTQDNIKVGDLVQSKDNPLDYYEVTDVGPQGYVYGDAMYGTGKGYIGSTHNLMHTGYTVNPKAPDIKAPESSGSTAKPGTKVTVANAKPGDTVTHSNYGPVKLVEFVGKGPYNMLYKKLHWTVELPNGQIKNVAQGNLVHGTPDGIATAAASQKPKTPKGSKVGKKVTAVNGKPGDWVEHPGYGLVKLVEPAPALKGKPRWIVETSEGGKFFTLQSRLVHAEPPTGGSADATAPTGPAAPSASSGLKSGDQIPESHQHLLKSSAAERNKQYVWQGSSGSAAGSSVAHQVCSKLHSSLSSKQKEALGSYRGSGYSSMNSTLRNGVKPSEYTSKQIAALDQAMGEASGIPHDMTFKRGKGSGVRKMLQDNVGKVFVEDGFTSLSNSESTAKGFAKTGGVLINVRVPKGTPGLYMDEIFGNNWEYELMLPRGCAFIVHSVTPSSGTHYSHVADIELIHPGQIGENPEQYKKWGIAPPEPPKPWTGKQFDSANQVKSWAIQNTAGAIGNSVSAEQQQAFDEFVGGMVHDVNGYYQGGKKSEKVKNDPALKDKVMKLANTISTAIASAPGTDQDITLKKMMASNYMSSQYSGNETVQDPGFPVLSNTPTSALSAQSAGQQAIEVTYHIPKGSKVAYLGDHPTTKEPLFALPKDSVFAVKESKKDGGLHKVTLEIK